MKKLFLAFMLLTGFVLASCGTNEYSTKSGDISFTIPVAQLANYTARTGSDEIEYEYTFIVQIEGSKGYYDYKTEKVTYKVDDIMDFSGLENIPFKFDKLPVNQKYKLFVDIIHQQLTEVSEGTNGHGIENSRYILLSGQTEDVAVSANATSPVSVDLLLGHDALSPFALEITYPNSTVEKRNMSEFVKYDGAASFISNVNGKLYVGASGGNGKEVSSIKFVFDDNSHFKHSGTFSFISEDFNADGTSKGPVEVKAQNGAIDLTSELKELDYEVFAKSIKVSLNNIDFDDSVHMHIGKQTYSYLQNYTDVNFKREPVLDGNDTITGYRYRATIPLSDLLGEQTFAKGDTLVFVMNELGPEYNGSTNVEQIPVSQFNYKLQKSGWESLDVNTVDLGVLTVNVRNLLDSAVLPDNFINGDEKYLQISFDVAKEGAGYGSSLPYKATFSCMKFDASEKVYVFKSDYYSPNSVYKYEMYLPVSDKLGTDKLTNTANVIVGITGTWEWSAFGYVDELEAVNAEVNLELANNAGVADCPHVPSNSPQGTKSYYHPLSEGGPKGNIVNGKQIDYFSISITQNPCGNDSDNDYRFQCYVQQKDTFGSKLLLIRNFDISLTKNPRS